MIDYIFRRVFLVTVHDPICTEQGDLSIALYGSFLPIPPDNAFAPIDSSEYAKEKLPGSIIVKNERIVINKGRERVKLRVTNNGDRPVQVCIQLRTSRIKHRIPDPLSFLFRLDHITTSSKQTRPLFLIAEKPMEND